MPIATVDQLKLQIGWTSDMGSQDDTLMAAKLSAAQDHIERWLGFKIEDRFGAAPLAPAPPSLVEAVLQLAALWYDSRDGAADQLRPLPFGIAQIIDSYREWSF